MTVRVLANPTTTIERLGTGILLKFRVPGSKFGPVEVQLDTNEALTLAEEIEVLLVVQS